MRSRLFLPSNAGAVLCQEVTVSCVYNDPTWCMVELALGRAVREIALNGCWKWKGIGPWACRCIHFTRLVLLLLNILLFTQPPGQGLTAPLPLSSFDSAILWKRSRVISKHCLAYSPPPSWLVLDVRLGCTSPKIELHKAHLLSLLLEFLYLTIEATIKGI